MSSQQKKTETHLVRPLHYPSPPIGCVVLCCVWGGGEATGCYVTMKTYNAVGWMSVEGEGGNNNNN